MVRVGILGVGFMGMIHYLAYKHVPGAKVAAISTRDKKKLAGDWRGIQGNFGPPGEMMDLGSIARYENWHDLIADPKIDLVDVCLPPKLHAEVSEAALRAGKHVICEKPIALATAEAKRMVKAAAQAQRLLLIAHVLPFVPEFAFVREAAASGKYGKLLGGHFKRIIADPLWLKDFYDPRSVGGPVVDLHIHDAHFIRLLWGMPKTVQSSGRRRGDVVEFINTQFVYDTDTLVTAASGIVHQQGRSFTHGFEVYFERATVTFDSSVLEGQPVVSMPLTVLTARGKVEHPKLREADPFAAELTDAVKAVRSGKPSALLAGDLALDALALCHKETESALKGKVVKMPSA
ncbi:MAG TPA: Gfo/Idh/MocA family oxidoreductase [Pirellulales bacterium]|nr:Gfo/Idh/MocA family oxidoreductase [Pirellulales bacterium]